MYEQYSYYSIFQVVVNFQDQLCSLTNSVMLFVTFLHLDLISTAHGNQLFKEIEEKVSGPFKDWVVSLTQVITISKFCEQ